MKKLSEEIRMAVFLLLLTIICTGLLYAGNFYYQKALAIKQMELRMEILRVFDIPFTEDSFFSIFSKSVEIREEKKTTYYINNNPSRGAVIISSGRGLWSIIELLIVVDIDEQKIRELRVLSHGETPGLGGRIEEPWFLDQFIDLDISQGLKIMKEKTGAAGEVDAVTGASHTSGSVERIINDALDNI